MAVEDGDPVLGGMPAHVADQVLHGVLLRDSDNQQQPVLWGDFRPKINQFNQSFLAVKT